MKKRISWLILWVTVFQLFTFRAAYADDEISFTGYEKLLFALNIADDSMYNTPSDVERDVTRAEFAEFTAAILGLDSAGGTSDNVYFKDVPVSNRSAGAINALAEYGIISGVGDYSFNPNDSILPEHAAILLLKAAGYTDVNAAGLSYDVLIARHKLLSGTSGTALDFEAAARLIYQALKMPKCTVSSLRNGEVTYEMFEEKTMLSENFSVYETDGTVTAAGKISLSDSVTASEGQMAIGGVVYDTDADAYPDLGRHVKAYYRLNKSDGEKNVILYYDDGKTDELIIDADDIVSVNGTQISYYSGRKTLTENLPANITAMYNGELVTRNLSGAFNIDCGQIRLLTDRSGDYAYAFITEYDHVFVSKHDPEIKTVYAKSGENIEYGAPGLKRFKVYGENGEEASTDDIKSETLLTVVRSAVNLEIYIGQSVVTGVISYTDGETMTVGGREYDISVHCNDKTSLVSGFSGTFYLDCRGEVAYVSNVSKEGFVYGYLKAADTEGLGSGLAMRIFKTDGSFETFKSTPKITVDGYRKSPEAALEYFKDANGGFRHGIIRYSVNSENKINAIDTSVSGNGETKYNLTETFGFASRIYCEIPRMFSGQLLNGAKTVTFFVPENISDENDFLILKGLSNQSTYYCAAYTADPDSFAPDAIVISAQKMEYTFSTESYIWVVDSVKKIYDPETQDTSIQITAGGTFNGYTTGQSGVKTIVLADDFELTGADIAIGCVSYEDIDAGDIVEFALDNNHEVHKIRKLFDYSDKNSTLAPRYFGDYLAYGRYFMGYANSRDGAYVKVGLNSPGEVDEILYIRADDYCKTLVYDSSRKENRVYEGSWEDVITYEETGSEKETSVIIPNYFQGGNPHETIIYKYGLENR